MTLPTKIEIQIIDASGKVNPIENIIFGLKIFTIDGGWCNCSPFKTGGDGHIILTKEQIIENTELKYSHNESNAPTRFELYIQDGQLMVGLIESIRRLLKLYENKEFLKEELRRRSIAGEDLSAAIEAIERKAGSDSALFEHIKDAVNNKIRVENPKIDGVWLDSLAKQYEFGVQL